MEGPFMKKVFKILMICLFLSSLWKPARAEEEGFDMSVWSFKILLQHADQSDELKVVRFKNKESGRCKRKRSECSTS